MKWLFLIWLFHTKDNIDTCSALNDILISPKDLIQRRWYHAPSIPYQKQICEQHFLLVFALELVYLFLKAKNDRKYFLFFFKNLFFWKIWNTIFSELMFTQCSGAHLRKSIQNLYIWLIKLNIHWRKKWVCRDWGEHALKHCVEINIEKKI